MALIKKYIGIPLSVILILSCFPVLSAFAFSSSAEDFVIKNNTLVAYTGENDSSSIVEIPSDLGITAIGKEAFANTAIGAVTIPEGVTVIEENAFANCQSITSVSLPSTLTTIGDRAFALCKSLKGVYLPQSVVNLGEAIFEKETSPAEFILWGTGNDSAARYAAECGYTYVNSEDVDEFGFYAYDLERWIPVYTHSSEGYFWKSGYTILKSGELIDALPPYLTWSSDNELLASAHLGMIVWQGEGSATIKAENPSTGGYCEFKLVVYYVDSDIIKPDEEKCASLAAGKSVSYKFSPDRSGEYQISASPSDGSLYFIISDLNGYPVAYGYDSLSSLFNAGETYMIEAFNFSEDSTETEYTFVIAEKKLTCTVSATAGGTVSGGGSYRNGDLIMLQAIPDDGYMFEGWYENDQKIPGATANYVIAISTDRTLKARFVPYKFEIADIKIEGIRYNGNSLTFTPVIIGGSGKIKCAFYIYGNGKMYYANANLSTPSFPFTLLSAGTYTAVAYSVDETGNKVSYSKQFTIV